MSKKTNDLMRQLQKYKYALEVILDTKDSIEIEAEEAPKRTVKKIQEQADSIIDRFYESYTPQAYERTGGLKEAYRIWEDDMNIHVDFDWRYMPDDYHQSASIVYQNVFVEGYHGGSLGKADITGYKPTVPSWRTPLNVYTFWSNEIVPSTFSPQKSIHSMYKKQVKIYENDYVNFLASHVHHVKKIVSEI